MSGGILLPQGTFATLSEVTWKVLVKASAGEFNDNIFYFLYYFDFLFQVQGQHAREGLGQTVPQEAQNVADSQDC